MLDQTFILIIICYQVILAGRDFVVTGILAKKLPPDWRFHVYCIVTTLEVTIVAVFSALSASEPLIMALRAWTAYLTWIGGGLDWIYFALRQLITSVPMPEWNFVWHWMPRIFPYITRGRITLDHPTTKHWAAYTALMWIPNVVCWSYVLLI